ncbi:AP-3 complex subunit sigma-1 isoform X1 [Gadus macrocephalus]|uniref:AP-3 complex subunit sigma-1 isoform X1 n=1 Tax=Gadus macrocephalus TaxID=80720 RepID=UPI0028CB9BD3|nr:AP-3 complex subunit sigma-1 isoform X1 [Gadus macrocephalus]
MIKAILIFNNHGKPRLSKFYEHYSEDTEQQIIRETFHLVSKRDENVCNFLEGGMLIGGSENKLIYRHYATLYFVFCVDSSESELGILDLIQVFVETLDKCFENVCELDLIFHVDKVHNILAEMVMGGMVLETNMNEIIMQVDAQNKMEKSEFFPFFSLFADVYLSVYQAGQVDTGRHRRGARTRRIRRKEHESPRNAQEHQHWRHQHKSAKLTLLQIVAARWLPRPADVHQCLL